MRYMIIAAVALMFACSDPAAPSSDNSQPPESVTRTVYAGHSVDAAVYVQVDAPGNDDAPLFACYRVDGQRALATVHTCELRRDGHGVYAVHEGGDWEYRVVVIR